MTVAGLLDTSVVIALGSAAPPAIPDRSAVSIMTIAELQVGVALARPEQRPARAAILARTERTFDALGVDPDVALQYGELVASMRRAGRRPGVADALIAATALVHGLPLYTRDEDFLGVPRLEVRGV